MPIPQYLLNLAGEYRVCSELNMRGVFATVTYGNRKSVDVYAINDRKQRAIKIGCCFVFVLAKIGYFKNDFSS